MPTSSRYLLVLEGKQKAQPVLRVRLVRPVRREKPVQPVPKETLGRPVLKGNLVPREQQGLQELKGKLVRLERPARLAQPVPKETLDRLVLKVRQDLQGLDLVLALAPLSGCSWRFRRGMPTT